jgi:hypothetical protein
MPRLLLLALPARLSWPIQKMKRIDEEDKNSECHIASNKDEIDEFLPQ